MHLSERFISQPWHILPACIPPMASRLKLLASEQQGEQPRKLTIADFVHQRQPMEITADGLALLHVCGTLGRNLVPVEKMCGDTDYNDVIAEVRAAAGNPAVRGIVVAIDSGGGSVVGASECRDAIAEASTQKPVVVYTEGMMCSAAYEIAAGASFLIGSPSSIVGSIGTITMLADFTGWYEQMGVKIHVIPATASDLKSTYWPQAALTDDQRADVQRFVDRWNEDFLNFVSLHRMDADSDSMRGQCFDARDALDRGLLDELGDFDTACRECLALAGR